MSEANEPQLIDTRERILALLCSGSQTTTDLARALGISANGVRGHLGQLGAEGLVAFRVVRRGVGRPAHEYRLTDTGSLRLSRAYLPVMSALLSAVLEREGAASQECLLREVGRTLGRQRARPEGTLRERVEAAVGLLRELGARCLVREEGEVLQIHGACCPLRALVPDHPLTCKVVEALLEEYIGATVSERCEKDGPPSCRLVIDGAG